MSMTESDAQAVPVQRLIRGAMVDLTGYLAASIRRLAKDLSARPDMTVERALLHVADSVQRAGQAAASRLAEGEPGG